MKNLMKAVPILIGVALLSSCKSGNIDGSSLESAANAGQATAPSSLSCTDANTAVSDLMNTLSACDTDDDCQYARTDTWTLIGRSDSVVLQGGCSPNYIMVNGADFTSSQQATLASALSAEQQACNYATCMALMQFNSNPPPVCNAGKCALPPGWPNQTGFATP
jgi:hypothetical protein